MAERDQLLRALKQVLKLRGMRYSDLARGLGVSEPTVKRMLSTGRIDLARLERICGLLDIDLFELVRVARGARAEREHLEPVQEERSEEHTSELQSLMRSSYAVFCLKKKQ